MKKRLILSLGLAFFCFSSHSFAATYDASGTWTSVNSGFWINQGTAGNCSQDTTRTETITIDQNGNSFTAIAPAGRFSGTISGATYSISTSASEEGGTVTTDIVFTLTSATTASGEIEWYWTDGSEYCEGGKDFSMTLGASQPTDSTTYDASGKWTAEVTAPIIDQGNSGECTGEPAHTETIDIDQSGDTFTASIKGRLFSGTISGATYTGSASYTKNGGSVAESLEINMTSETTASGTGEWRWSDGTYYCSGTYSITFSKSDSDGGDGGGGGGGCLIDAILME
jgi:hypothetical protein